MFKIYHFKLLFPTDFDQMIDIMLQCTSALVHMHFLKEPIVHRDIKPGNVLFTRQGGKDVAKLADFGLAKVMQDVSKLNTVAGTVLYMAPELLLEEPYDHTVDIFSLGLLFLSLVLFEVIGELVPLSGKKITEIL